MSDSLKLTTRGQYAVMAMVELAKNQAQNKPVPLSDIAQNAKISLSYLEQLIAGLRRHGLVKSCRGPGGGYTLARPLNEIAVSEILCAAEDSTPAKRANQSEYRTNNCEHTNMLWHHIGEFLNVTLNTITLKDVVEKRIENHPVTVKINQIVA